MRIKLKLFAVQHFSAVCVHHQGAHIVDCWRLTPNAVPTRQGQLDLLYR